MKIIRLLYLIPDGVSYKNKYKSGIVRSILDFQKWCSQNTKGYTFKINNPIVEVKRINRNVKWYRDNPLMTRKDLIDIITKSKKLAVSDSELQGNYIWIIFIDAPIESNIVSKKIICLSENYLKGFIGLHQNEKYAPRWIGKMGKKIGQAFGLKEPGEVEKNALMQYGYAKYPNCYLTRENIKILEKSPFLYDDFFSSTHNYDEYDKERFLYNMGYFIKVNKNKWEERRYNGKTFYYKEINRDDKQILLKDKARKLFVRLFIIDGYSESSEDNVKWYNYFKIEPLSNNLID